MTDLVGDHVAQARVVRTDQFRVDGDPLDAGTQLVLPAGCAPVTLVAGLGGGAGTSELGVIPQLEPRPLDREERGQTAMARRGSLCLGGRELCDVHAAEPAHVDFPAATTRWGEQRNREGHAHDCRRQDYSERKTPSRSI